MRDLVVESVESVEPMPSDDASPPRARGFAVVREALAPRLAPDSAVPIYAGLGLALIGFILIGYTWAEVAGTLAIQVQLPYIVSGGLTGLAFVIAGSTVVNIAVRRREAARRQERLEALGVVLDALARVSGDVGDDEGGDRP